MNVEGSSQLEEIRSFLPSGKLHFVLIFVLL